MSLAESIRYNDYISFGTTSIHFGQRHIPCWGHTRYPSSISDGRRSWLPREQQRRSGLPHDPNKSANDISDLLTQVPYSLYSHHHLYVDRALMAILLT